MRDDAARSGFGFLPSLDESGSTSPEVVASDVAKGWRTLGEIALEAVKGSRPTIERDGVWATLSRDACNRLVRFVRKARDAAYGRDE